MEDEGDGGGEQNQTVDIYDMTMEGIKEHVETQHAGKSSQNIKSIVYGGIDGVITTFSIIASAYGAGLAYNTIIVLGISNLIADGFSMGFGDFISSRLESKYVMSEFMKEKSEYNTNLDGEKMELVTIYTSPPYNMDSEDVWKMVDIMAKSEVLFLQNMMRDELGLDADYEGVAENARNSARTFFSFLFFGFIPISVYIIGLGFPDRDENAVFAATSVFSGATLFLVGVVSSKLSKQKVLGNSLLTLANGATAATLAFLIGWSFESAIPK